MIPVTTFRGASVAVFGLGGSGLSTCAALREGGARVIAWDDNPASVDKAAAAGHETADLRTIDWSGVAALVLAPGVPLTHPAPHWSVGLARAHGVEVLGDVELFCRERRATAPLSPFVAITGTNGKSTTTALITHILAATGRDPQMGGNIGTAVLSLAPPATGRTHVVECSSFQIDLAPSLDPSVGICLNVTPDHLDRHGTLDLYAGVKERLVAGVPVGGTVVCGVDDRHTQAMADRTERAGRRVLRISIRNPVADGLCLDGQDILRVAAGAVVKRFSLAGCGALRGTHNAQNAMAAYAACEALGLSHEAIVAAMLTFPGLAHRMEQVGRLGKVLFVNDSKATNADSAEKALAAFSDIYWIAGGTPKEGGIAPLAAYFPRIVKSYLIGKSAEDFAVTLGSCPHVVAGTLDKAVAMAAADAAAGGAAHPVVLLSPACASYDQFPNFEVRGKAFRDLVLAMPGVEKV
ncbi:UDP-N-acetylmuramoyl-L-alanine--D-glutamate ligase [Phreatobacter oligotrophus]|uniref:UDP-N-acetylmuramoyl-L-alanine--D-glutamate ligase n=1 Tax=Phreatobacter oligotrophus TaxID=1122261 RepID=UPI0023569987|nr:UDP-N-acetylmuramoyl-L-alanine--D-glutamate ligase [Phreatobacter oligotrophus]MBX9991848.1 UDP-N-acetylmuramoyl-L-alanine--D-glutamate ligase [Phreatobacter oligotrophus]